MKKQTQVKTRKAAASKKARAKRKVKAKTTVASTNIAQDYLPEGWNPSAIPADALDDTDYREDR